MMSLNGGHSNLSSFSMRPQAPTRAHRYLPPHIATSDRLLFLTPESHRFQFMPCLMSSVACNDGILEVPRNYTKTLDSSSLNDGDNDDDGTETVTCPEMHKIFHRVFRPMSLTSRQAAPLLVLHGGPSVPSDYLFPLVDHVPYRSIVFYDQLGCGRSDEPTDPESYSIEKSLDDLELLITKLGLRRFHLYGQSFGGILAYEYIKRMAEQKKDSSNIPKCLSVILSSTPTSVSLTEQEANRLLGVIVNMGAVQDEAEVGDLFRQQHQCRGSPDMPTPLRDAYAHAGTGPWRGTTAIQDYVATPPGPDARRMPSAMIMRGEYDFVTNVCTKDWKEGGLFNHGFVREKVLEDCSHHGLLENGKHYGALIDSFCSEYD